MTAFRATYSDFKFIKTRDSVQIIFEVPRHDADAALEILGGMPTPSSERWFGIAPLTAPASAMPQPGSDKPPAGAKRDWRELQPPQQAGIRCAEEAFATFLKERHADDWHEAAGAAECVRLICGVNSRAELATNHKARVAWHQLDSEYQAWMRVA